MNLTKTIRRILFGCTGKNNTFDPKVCAPGRCCGVLHA